MPFSKPILRFLSPFCFSLFLLLFSDFAFLLIFVLLKISSLPHFDWEVIINNYLIKFLKTKFWPEKNSSSINKNLERVVRGLYVNLVATYNLQFNFYFKVHKFLNFLKLNFQTKFVQNFWSNPTHKKSKQVVWDTRFCVKCLQRRLNDEGVDNLLWDVN